MGRRPALLVLGDALGIVGGLNVGDVELTLGVSVLVHDGVGWAAHAANDNDEQADHAASLHGVSLHIVGVSTVVPWQSNMDHNEEGGTLTHAWDVGSRGEEAKSADKTAIGRIPINQ